MVQLQQQAVQEGLQPLALAAVHGCWRVTRRLQDAVDPSPEARGSKRAREQAEQAGSRDLDSEVAPSSPAAARSDWGRGQAPPYPLTPAPPPLPHHAPSSPPPPLSRLRLSRHLGERGQLVGGGKGIRDGVSPEEGRRGWELGMCKAPGSRGWQGRHAGAKPGPWAAEENSFQVLVTSPAGLALAQVQQPPASPKAGPALERPSKTSEVFHQI